jgi:hypothetical protein
LGVFSGSITKVSAAALLFLLAGCRSNAPRRSAAIGEAYVGPALLNIRRELSVQSPTVASVKHGERVEILQQRRVFFRVRTAKGAEGWTTGSQLLSASDMADMRQMAERAAKMPAQGQAITYDVLRVHALPSARSPGFTELQAKEKFTVLGHVVMPRIDLPRAPLIPPAPKKAPAKKKESKTEVKLPPPPVPPPPPLPSNWQDLSKPELEEDPQEQEPPTPAAPTPEDDWSLIRAAGGQTGWVLTRRISMAIPDEVAQYAEGRRIVSYFSLGTIEDGDARKDIWLWTTAGEGHPPYDFESFRVFIWSVRRHRYETAYIERRIQGYEPVLLDRISYGGSGNSKSEPGVYSGFSVCMRKANGTLVRRQYVLLTNVVRFAGETACVLPPPLLNPAAIAKTRAVPAPPQPQATAPAPEKRSLMQRLKEKLQSWRRH